MFFSITNSLSTLENTPWSGKIIYGLPLLGMMVYGCLSGPFVNFDVSVIIAFVWMTCLLVNEDCLVLNYRCVGVHLSFGQNVYFMWWSRALTLCVYSCFFLLIISPSLDRDLLGFNLLTCVNVCVFAHTHVGTHMCEGVDDCAVVCLEVRFGRRTSYANLAG